MTLTTGKQARRDTPITSGVLDYFPDALAEVARVSKVGNDQHNPGEPMHWAKEKSTDEADALVRHLIERGTIDTDGLRHSAKVAWRALALLQRELDQEAEIAAVSESHVVQRVYGDEDYFTKVPLPNLDPDLVSDYVNADAVVPDEVCTAYERSIDCA